MGLERWQKGPAYRVIILPSYFFSPSFCSDIFEEEEEEEEEEEKE